MNKVTSYLKNVGKSVAYATVDVATNKLIPEVVEFTSTNEELFKATYATLVHFKKSVRQTTILAKQSQIYKDINTGIDNALEDIKTGNFYNKARSDKSLDDTASSLVGGSGEFDDADFDFGDWDDDDGSLDIFGDEEESSVSKGDLVIADSVAKSGNLSAQLISKTVANTSSNIIKTNITSNNMLMAQNAELVAGIRTSIAGVHESINSILKFTADVIPSHFNTQSQYFTDSINVMRENNAILKEMLEMQRNVYKEQQEQFKSRDQMGSVFSGGTLDLTEYAKAIWKNTKNLDKSGSLDMLFSEMGGTTMLGQMLSNPLGTIATGVIERFIPKDFAKQVASFSKSLGSIFPIMITRLNKWKNDDKGGIYTLLGNIFGLESDTKTNIDTSKYNKGAVAFDGITRKAIVDVIPEHLSKIESLLSGTSQRVYDFETGKWTTAKDIKKKKEDEYENIVKSSFSDLNDDIRTFIRTLEKEGGLSPSKRRSLDEDIYKMMKSFFEGDTIFSPQQIKKNVEDQDYNEDAYMVAFADMLSNLPPSKLASVYENVFDNKRKFAQNRANAESKGHDILRKVFDNSGLDSHLKYDSEFTDQIVGNKTGFSLLNIRDESGFNTLDYLKQILINVSYIREFGSGIGGKNVSKSSLIVPQSGKVNKSKNEELSDFDSYSKSFDTKYIPKELQDLRKRRNEDDERYDKMYAGTTVPEADAAGAAVYNSKKNDRFSNLDKDEFENFGKWYKEKNKWMKEMEEIPGDTFIQKWTNAQNMKQKQILIMGSLSDIARKPATLLTGMIATAEKSIYNFLFQAETDEFDDDAGEKIKGFFPAMLKKMSNAWYDLTAKIDTNIITPLVKKYGLDEKWENLKNRISESGPMTMLRNAGYRVKHALGRDISGMYTYAKDSITDVAAPVIYDRNFVDARVNALKARVNKANAKDNESIKSILGDLTPEQLKAVKEKAPPEILKAIEKAGFNTGGTGIVEEPGVIAVSEGEIVNVSNPNGKNSKDKDEEIDNIIQHLSKTIGNKKTRMQTGLAKIRRLNTKANQVNSTIVSDTLSQGVDELKTEVYEPVKNKVKNLLGIEGDTPQEQEASTKKEKNKLLTTVSNIFTEMKGEGANTISKAIIGSGVGLLSGIIGGPLIGAGIGVATSFIKNSNTINKAVFGEDIEDENGNKTHKEGLISKKIQDTFKKYIPDMGKFGVTGAVASLITPFGPLAGAAIGAGVGLLKNSETMNKMIFGEEITNEKGEVTGRKGGLLTEARLEKIKKYLPKAAVGALVGAGTSLIGPFGILGGAALGAGLGMLTGTEEFKDLIFGEDDGQGNRIGGLKDALNEYFVQPLKDFGRNFKDDFFGFIKESMIDPLNDAITPIASEIAFQTKRVVFGIPKWFLNLGKDYIAMPILNKLEDKVIDPIGKGIKSLFGSMFSRFKGLISAPFRAVGAIGNATRKHQIKQGRDVVGTAKDRLKFADDKNIGNYKYRSFDEKLSEKSDDQNYLEELTARTGMLAHGSDYFNKEVKKARAELSRVVADYYKLGWFSKDKKSYKRIRQYIHDNDIESAIEELTNIKESRTTGGPLDAEANNVIARFTKANKAYQVARDNRDRFGDINESENAAWMEKQFGPNWRSMKADRLFDYSRKELAKTTGKNVSKNDLFSDPTKLITEGDKQINNTLLEIYKLLSGSKYEFQNEADNEAYSEGAKSGTKAANRRIRVKKSYIWARTGFKGNTLNLLYQNPDVYDLVLSASADGIKYDEATIEKLCNMKLSKKEISLLKKYPSAALMEEKDIKKNLDFTRNDHGTFFNNRLFGAKRIRNKNLSLFDMAGEATSDFRNGKLTAMTPDQLAENKIDSDEKYKWVETQYGIRRYYKDKKGDMTLDMSDAETKESLEKEKEDKSFKKVFMSDITSLKDSVFGLFSRNKEKDEEEKKEPWYKKLFNAEIGSKVKFGIAIAGLLTGVGAIKNLWDSSKENNGVVYRIGSAVGNAVGPYITKLKDWFTNEGEYTDTQNTGFQGFLNQHVFPNMFKGINVIFSKILPAVIISFINNIPTLIKSALTGVGSLFGWIKNDEHKNDASFNFANIKFNGKSIASDGITGSSTWVNDTLSDASLIADSITNININNTGSNTTITPNVSDETLGVAGNSAENTVNRNGVKDKANNNAANDILKNSGIDPNALAEVDGIGDLYVKDADGNLVQGTYQSLIDSGEFYNEDGSGHWIIDDATGNITAAEDSRTSTDSNVMDQFAKRLEYSAARSFVTGREAGIFKHGKKILGAADSILSNTIGRTKILGGMYKKGAAVIKGVGSIFEKAGSIGKLAGNKWMNAFKTTGTASGTVNKLVKESKIYNSNMTKRIINFVKAGFDKILNIGIVKSTIKKVVKSSGKKATDTVIKNIIETISKTFIGSVTKNLAKASSKVIAKFAAAIGTGGLVTAAFALVDFLTGMDKAESILKIKEPNIVQTLLAGLVNVVTNELFFGLIDSATIVDMLTDAVLPRFNIDITEFKLARDETSKEVEEYNKAYGDDLSEEEYLEKNNSITGKIKDTLSKLNPFKKDNLKDNFSNTSSTNTSSIADNKYNDSTYTTSFGYAPGAKGISGKGTSKSGFVSQLDPKYKSKKFNISGDTEYQTLGDSGCAPATASNVINLFRGQGSTMDDASKAALKYKDRNGGVTPDYFDDYLGRNGIGTYSTTNKQEMLSGIGSGQPTILLGTDPTNKANTPYGAASSHYVLATGLDGKGNIIVQDPESRKPNALYPAVEVINQTQMGMITAPSGMGRKRKSGRGSSKTKTITTKIRPKFKKVGFGKGNNTINQDLGTWSPLSDSEIDAFIKRMNSKSTFTGKAINAAANASGLDPRYILAHAAVESAWGTSNYGKNNHNYFGIGAFDSNPDNAVNYGNNSMEAGLINGAVWIRRNYYDAGQKTLYEMRYSKSGTHNYCTSTTWPYTIASIMDSMPASTNASYHEANSTDDAGTASSNQSANGLFAQLSTAMLSYYDSNLIELLWGSNTSESGSTDDYNGPTGDSSAIVAVAKNEVGTVAGANKKVKYSDEYGLPNQDWCAMFCWWVFKHAGCEKAFMGGGKDASAQGILNYYKNNGQTINAKSGKPGDLIFFDWNNNGVADHVGIIVKSNNDGSYVTIEGNTDTKNYPNGAVREQTRGSYIMGIARPKFEDPASNISSTVMDRVDAGGKGTRKFKNIAAAAMLGKGTNKFGNTMVSSLSGRGTKKSNKYIADRFRYPETNTLELSSNNKTSNKTLSSSTKYQTTIGAPGINSGKGTGLSMSSYRRSSIGSGFSLPGLAARAVSNGLNTDTSSYGISRSSYNTSGSTNNLLTVIIEILQIIANNSEKLSEIVTLLSKALDLNLTNNDISELSSNNAQVKNKIANALKRQGSMNGLGDSTMSSTTESLAAAMYSIARA